MRRRIQSMPEHRLPALRKEKDLLDRTIESRYIYPEDVALAWFADSQ